VCAGYLSDRAKQLSYELAFNLTSYLHGEQDYVPWAAFFDAVGFIAGMLSTSDAYGPLQVLVHPFSSLISLCDW